MRKIKVEFKNIEELSDFINKNIPTIVDGVNCNTKYVSTFTCNHVKKKVINSLVDAIIKRAE
jgi:hypothetical protein